jgi:hypothetical protein
LNVPKPIDGQAISSAPPAGTPTPTPEPTPVPAGAGPAGPVPANVYLGPFTDVYGAPISPAIWQAHSGAIAKAPEREDVVFCLPMPAEGYGSCRYDGYPTYPKAVFAMISNVQGDLTRAASLDPVNGTNVYVDNFLDRSKPAYINWRVDLLNGRGPSGMKWGP